MERLTPSQVLMPDPFDSFKNITRLLWGGYLLSILVTAAMMLLTCILAIRKSLTSPPFWEAVDSHFQRVFSGPRLR